MVKILEKAEWLKEERCTGKGNGGNGCNSLLGLEQSDLRYFTGGGYFERDPAVLFKCPVCGALTDIDKSKWPQQYIQLKPFTSAWRDGTEIEED